MQGLQGFIHEINETQQVTPTFSKREWVVKTMDNPEYPQLIALELTKDKCSLLDQFSVGQEVKVSYNLRGRAWTNAEGKTRYFNTVQAWRIEPLEGSNNVVTPKEDFAGFQVEDDGTDLPF